MDGQDIFTQQMEKSSTSIREKKRKREQLVEELSLVEEQIKTEEKSLTQVKKNYSPRVDGYHNFNVIISSGGKFWHVGHDGTDLPRECLRNAKGVKKVSF